LALVGSLYSTGSHLANQLQGIFKPNILPTVLDQYQRQRPYVKTLKNGTKVIVDPELTINRISLIFYCFVNVGAFLGIGTAYAEKRVGFWLAFLVPGVVYFMLPLLLLATKHKTYRRAPNGSDMDQFFRVFSFAVLHNKFNFFKKGFWDSVKPSVLRAQGIDTYRGKPITWDDKLVEDVRRTLGACVMFLWFPIWYLNDGGIGVVATSQASNMTTAGAPNDLLGNFNPLTIIFFVPLLTYGIYPALERFNLMPGRITRITFGFTLAWISSIVGAIIQWHVYQTSPCGYRATTCESGVSPISVWVQVPIFVLGAMSECFCQVTAYEIAYARSPRNMKSLVMAFFLLMNALSSAISLALTPAIKDPGLIWVWAGPAITLFVITIGFYFVYRKMNSDDFMLDEQKVAAGLPVGAPSKTSEPLEDNVEIKK
jgi:dipeptide/tripeptide permease